MESFFISEIDIESVRHLNGIKIPLSKEKRKHLILTGKNGSGKTSVLDALGNYLDYFSAYGTASLIMYSNNLRFYKQQLEDAMKEKKATIEIENIKEKVARTEQEIADIMKGIDVQFTYSLDNMEHLFKKGNFIISYYRADRIFNSTSPIHVEKVQLKDSYGIKDKPREDFIKYLLDLKTTQALALTGGKKEKADKIQQWFEKFDQLLKKIFDDKSVQLDFDEDTFHFWIKEDGKLPYDFNTLSSGYAAVLDIVLDIIMRMEKQSDKTFFFDTQGIVLIDEIETHLHLELQKRILDLLTTIFPNIQFIVSTHSPFILNSRDDVVIYDLHNHVLVENGLTNIPYEGIVEGYFKADAMSDELRNKFTRYKELVIKEDLQDKDFEEIAKLEMYLDEIPDYLAIGIATEYKRLKIEFENREDIEICRI